MTEEKKNPDDKFYVYEVECAGLGDYESVICETQPEAFNLALDACDRASLSHDLDSDGEYEWSFSIRRLIQTREEIAGAFINSGQTPDFSKFVRVEDEALA